MEMTSGETTSGSLKLRMGQTSRDMDENLELIDRAISEIYSTLSNNGTPVGDLQIDGGAF
jgi:hypothetical protein